MRKLVLTVIGKDKTGLVEQLSQVCLNHDANWLGSNLSYLSGYFAGVIEVAVTEPNLQPLADELGDIDGLDITIHYGEPVDEAQQQEIELVITGNDRKGIVQELASVISHKGANIISFVSRHQSAPNWGGELFHAVAKVGLPPHLSADAVVNALEKIATDIVVDVELEQAV